MEKFFRADRTNKKPIGWKVCYLIYWRLYREGFPLKARTESDWVFSIVFLYWQCRQFEPDRFIFMWRGIFNVSQESIVTLDDIYCMEQKKKEKKEIKREYDEALFPNGSMRNVRYIGTMYLKLEFDGIEKMY